MTATTEQQDFMISKLKSHLKTCLDDAEKNLKEENYDAFSLNLEKMLTIVRNSKKGARMIDIIDCFGEIPITIKIIKDLSTNIADFEGEKLVNLKMEINGYLLNIHREIIN